MIGTTWQVIKNLATNTDKLETVIPKEGSTGWSDTWMVSSKAAHPNCMYMWMDYITSPAVQAQVAYYFGEAPANPKACAEIATQFADDTHCDVFKATDEAFAKSIAFWATPRKECLERQGQRLRAVRRLDQGLDRDQGLTPLTATLPGQSTTAESSPGRSASRWLHRHPRVRLVSLIGAPAAWMLVLYIGSLASLFLTSLYRLNEDGSGIEKVISTQNYQTLLNNSVYFDIAVRTVKIAALVTIIDIVLALPIAFFMAKIAKAALAATARCRRCSSRCGPRTW